MNRVPFSGFKRLHRHARVAARWRRRSAKGNRDTTARYARSNPGNGFMQRVKEAAIAFKRQHGGQAYGWAADQVSMAPRGEKRQFWAAVTAMLKRDLYAMNPKRKHGSTYNRLHSKWKHASRMMDRHETWDPNAKNRRRKKWRSANYRATRQIAKHLRRGNPHHAAHRHGRPNSSYCSICGRREADASSIAHVELGERPDRSMCYASQFPDRHCRQGGSSQKGRGHRWPHRSRRNPKRDGTPTRGELRKDKYKDHLRALRERGDRAAAELNKLLGRGVHKPQGEAALKAPKTETQEQHPGHFAAEQTSDQKFAQESLSQVEALMADVRSQMKDLGDDDEALADELSDQLVKLGDQRRALQARVRGEMQTATNPRRRNPRYVSPKRYARMSHEQRSRYRRALRQLRATVLSIR